MFLGSATPSLESYRNSQCGKFEYLHLPDRVPGATLPEVFIVDMKEERTIVKKNVLLSRKLVRHIKQSLEREEQVLLFLNRRGFHVFGRCNNCYSVLTCPHCDISLTYHRSSNSVSCHFCGWKSDVIYDCPECNHPTVVYAGAGTERVEDVLEQLFPDARVARMDADTTSRRGSHSDILGAFRKGENDILLGTQMIAKGLDYPRISTVGVIDADISLAFPDFRSQERTFQLLSQVAGRTGRGTNTRYRNNSNLQTRSSSDTICCSARLYFIRRYGTEGAKGVQLPSLRKNVPYYRKERKSTGSHTNILRRLNRMSPSLQTMKM